MIRLSKLTDYGFVLLTRFAGSDGGRWYTARDLADETGLPLPTVSKLLKVFGRGGLLTAQRGARGGYSLSRDANRITASDIIEVIDGPIAITDCVCSTSSEACVIEEHCATKPHWLRISQTIRDALDNVTLAELAKPAGSSSSENFKHRDSKNCDAGFCNTVPGEACTCGDHLHKTGDMK